MLRTRKYLLLIQMLLLNVIGLNITQCAARIHTEQTATEVEIELIDAVTFAKKEKIEELIKQGANVNAVDSYSWTALIAAVCNEHKDIVELLIKAQADVNFVDNSGNTALIGAAWKSNKKIVELLLLAGADIEHKNNLGNIAQPQVIWLSDSETIKNNKKDIVKMLKDEPSRRAEVIKKWIKENLARIINESTQGILIPDIANIITDYTTIEYIDLPLEYRLAS